MSHTKTTLIRDIDTIAGVYDEDVKMVSGPEMAKFPMFNNGWILIKGDRIDSLGSMEHCPENADEIISAAGQCALPAWCDSHTHIVFAAWRESEFVNRIEGLSYEEIARKGGGILNSAGRLRDTPEDQLFESALERLHEVRGLGTGMIEIKSGYGLSKDSELKMLRVIRKLKERVNMPIKATFLGAHAVPAEYKQNRAAYIQLLTDEMLPEIAGEGLADYIDVFCDRGFFTPEETETILEAGMKYGLRGKIHANELGITGGVQVGVKMNALSVDHLECVGEEEIAYLKNSHTFPVALPGTSFFLGIDYAPARKMIDAGLPLVIASDYNPGSTPNGDMNFIISLACIKMKMLPEEAFNAATINGAAALEWSDQAGSLTPGKLANIILTDKIPSLAWLPYKYTGKRIHKVMINGVWV
jgi:imidazolonepropionase